MRRDPEAIAAYRQILAEYGVDATDMSDELVIEKMQRVADALLEFGKRINEAMKPVLAACAQAGRQMTDFYASAAGAGACARGRGGSPASRRGGLGHEAAGALRRAAVDVTCLPVCVNDQGLRTMTRWA